MPEDISHMLTRLYYQPHLTQLRFVASKSKVYIE